MDFGKYAVANVKTFRGMEDEGFNASLCFDGKAVAFCIYSGDGGSLDIEWADHKSPQVEVAWVFEFAPDETVRFRCSPDEAALWEHCRGQVEAPDEFFPEGRKIEPEDFVNALVCAFLQKRDDERRLTKMKKQCERYTLFRTEGMAPGDYMMTTLVFCEATKTAVSAKHKVTEWINESLGIVPSDPDAVKAKLALENRKNFCKKILRMAEKKTVFRLRTDKAGTYRSIPIGFDAAVRERVIDRYGVDKIEFFVNEYPEQVK